MIKEKQNQKALPSQWEKIIRVVSTGGTAAGNGRIVRVLASVESATNK